MLMLSFFGVSIALIGLMIWISKDPKMKDFKYASYKYTCWVLLVVSIVAVGTHPVTADFLNLENGITDPVEHQTVQYIAMSCFGGFGKRDTANCKAWRKEIFEINYSDIQPGKESPAGY